MMHGSKQRPGLPQTACQAERSGSERWQLHSEVEEGAWLSSSLAMSAPIGGTSPVSGSGALGAQPNGPASLASLCFAPWHRQILYNGVPK